MYYSSLSRRRGRQASTTYYVVLLFYSSTTCLPLHTLRAYPLPFTSAAPGFAPNNLPAEGGPFAASLLVQQPKSTALTSRVIPGYQLTAVYTGNKVQDIYTRIIILFII